MKAKTTRYLDTLAWLLMGIAAFPAENDAAGGAIYFLIPPTWKPWIWGCAALAKFLLDRLKEYQTAHLSEIKDGSLKQPPP